MSEEINTLRQETSLEQYAQPGKRIAKGGQGTVYKYTHGPTGNVYAAKVLYYDFENIDPERNRNNQVFILREQYVTPRFVHAHLIKAHKVFEYEEGIVIIMPYFHRGNLGQLSLDSTQLKDGIRQILEALRHLHEQGYIHRDIKPANVLVRNRAGDPLDLVVADYGLISLSNPVSFCGSRGYMAPEIVRNGGIPKSQGRLYHKTVDIYALGMLILRTLGISTPQVEIMNRRIFKNNIKSLVDDGLDECNPEDSEHRGALLTADRMLQYDPETRPSIDECLRLPWLSRSATTPPAAIQLSRTLSNRSLIDSHPDTSMAKPFKDWWNSDPRTQSPEPQVQEQRQFSGRYKLRKRNQTQQPVPISTPNKHKVQKRRYNPLLTPGPTPKRDRKAQKSGDSPALKASKSENAGVTFPNLQLKKSHEVSQDANTLLSWDKMELSD